MEGIPGSQKPSKPEEDLVAYIRQLEIPLQDVSTRVLASPAPLNLSTLLNDDDKILIGSVFREIHKREASLTTHKQCSVVLDDLLQVASAPMLLSFLRCSQPYLMFLTTNRYASHVIEGALSMSYDFLSGARVVEVSKEEEDGDAADGDDDDDKPKTPADLSMALVDAIVSWAEVARVSLGDMIFDTCGTHVLRSLIYLLSGRQPVAHKRGVDRKPGKAEGAADAPEAGAGDGSYGDAGAKRKQNAAAAAASAAAVSTTTAGATASISKAFYAGLPEGGAGKFKQALVRISHALGEAERAAEAEGEEATLEAKVAVREPQPAATGIAAAASNLVAVACDANASPTAQILFDACVSSAPATAKYLCRRFVGAACTDLSESELSGAADVSRSSEEKTGKKRKRAEASEDATPIFTPDVEAYLDKLCHDTVGSRLLESLILHADGKLFNELFTCYFDSHLLTLSEHAAANFVLQRLIVSCRGLEQTESTVSRLSKAIPGLVARRKEGVVWHLAAACVGGAAIAQYSAGKDISNATAGKATGAQRLPVVPVFAGSLEPVSSDLQQAFIGALAATCSLGATEDRTLTNQQTRVTWRANDPHFARWWLDINGYRAKCPTLAASPEPATLSVTRATRSAAVSTGITPVVCSPTGERIIAAVLHFRPTLLKHVIDSLINLPPEELCGLASAPFSSRHIFEAILDAGSEFAFAKTKIHNALRGTYAQLACTRFGCWVVSKSFTVGDIKIKEQIATELSDHERAVMGNASGRQVAKTVRLEHYKRNAESWTASWARSNAKADMFADIISSATPGAVKHAASEKKERKEKREGGEEAAPRAHKKARKEEPEDEEVADHHHEQAEEGEEGGEEATESKHSKKEKKDKKEKKEKKETKEKKEREDEEAEEAPTVKKSSGNGSRVGGARVDSFMQTLGFK